MNLLQARPGIQHLPHGLIFRLQGRSHIGKSNSFHQLLRRVRDAIQETVRRRIGIAQMLDLIDPERLRNVMDTGGLVKIEHRIGPFPGIFPHQGIQGLPDGRVPVPGLQPGGRMTGNQATGAKDKQKFLHRFQVNTPSVRKYPFRSAPSSPRAARRWASPATCRWTVP